MKRKPANRFRIISKRQYEALAKAELAHQAAPETIISDKPAQEPVERKNRPVTDPEAIKRLTFAERSVLTLRQGLDDGYSYTLQEVGRILKITRERVRQLEKKAILKLTLEAERQKPCPRQATSGLSNS